MLVVVGAVLAALGSGAEVSYLTEPVERGDLRTTVTATGTLNAVVTVKVGSQLSGQIAELPADFNDEVKKGQPIAKLDPQTFAARAREAEAALDVAKATVAIERASVDKAAAEEANARAALAVAEARSEGARVKADDAQRELQWRRSLLERATVAQSDVDRALADSRSADALLRATEGELEVQKSAIRAAAASRAMAEADLQHARAAVKQHAAALDQAEVELGRTVIRAPIDGVIIGRDIDRGQTVAAAMEAPTLFTIAQDLRQMEVHAKIDEADIGRIIVGQRAGFTVDAYPEREFVGTVAQIRKAPEVTQNVVTYTVLISADNPDLLLLPGMTAIVQIAVKEVQNVLRLPNAALRFHPPNETAVRAEAAAGADAVDRGTPAMVWVLDDARHATPVQIAIGDSDARATELVAGPLAEGEQVIVGAMTTAAGRSFLGVPLGF
jgi:HlyD family secretion protein